MWWRRRRKRWRKKGALGLLKESDGFFGVILMRKRVVRKVRRLVCGVGGETGGLGVVAISGNHCGLRDGAQTRDIRDFPTPKNHQ